MTITLDSLDALFDFQCNATLADFHQAFGDLGEHLWTQFKRVDYNLVRLYGLLDDRNSALLVNWLNARAQMLQGVLA